MIANIARTCFPELSLSRLREVEAEHDTFMAVLPIFYCEFFVFVFFVSPTFPPPPPHPVLSVSSFFSLFLLIVVVIEQNG